ncbi:MAG: hypothetical protein ACRDLL_10715 [Solirubrobacterales bacterium]
MELMARLFRPPWGASFFSAIISVITGLAIFALGAPPMILIPVSWATAIGYMTIKGRIVRRLGPR